MFTSKKYSNDCYIYKDMLMFSSGGITLKFTLAAILFNETMAHFIVNFRVEEIWGGGVFSNSLFCIAFCVLTKYWYLHFKKSLFIFV